MQKLKKMSCCYERRPHISEAIAHRSQPFITHSKFFQSILQQKLTMAFVFLRCKFFFPSNWPVSFPSSITFFFLYCFFKFRRPPRAPRFPSTPLCRSIYQLCVCLFGCGCVCVERDKGERESQRERVRERWRVREIEICWSLQTDLHSPALSSFVSW